MDEHHVGNTAANLVERGPDVVAEGQGIIFGGMTVAPASEHNRRSLRHRRTAFGLGTGAQEIATFDQRYERGSTIVTSNLPFEDWTSVLGSERLTGALLDRLTHRVNILAMNGDSYRLKEAAGRRRAAATQAGAVQNQATAVDPDTGEITQA
jgi:hypothetical protein